ncbi:MAG: hypothetical protein H6988_02615 [Pseudomonadales bacterium]|nr:hypothetical protein [Halieaceae bacterium]MCP5163640.1 hypothetical protein [Pseudomonadales bacterium]MCP5189264.1 hypothetical protein [Pseudomonadales bacterium]MCP5204476.1 hypothetical protein [Pseudomonadales bacterium]
MVLLLIAGLPVTMILGATWLWYFVVRGDLDLVGSLGTSNRGVLVQPPRQIDEFALLDQDGSPFRYGDTTPKWTLLVSAGGGRCDSACEGKLYLTRQIHVALGKEFNRVRRAYLSDSSAAATELAVTALSDGHPLPGDFSSYLADEHRGLQLLQTDPAVLATLLPESQADPSTWYLVDPAGWVMMSYNSETSYRDVIADLKFLLKNSGE